MYGIDASHWDEKIDFNKINIDFCICKATEGTNYVDPTFKRNIDELRNNNILFGFYHFASGGNAKKEAEHFYKEIVEYLYEGIPALDFEINIQDSAKWCEEFILEFYNLTGVWCMIYISASYCEKFYNSWIPERCALWVAGYPKEYNNFVTDIMPYDISPFDTTTLWQFTSSLLITGHNDYLDGDVAYLTKENWYKISNPNNENNQMKQSTDELAEDVINGCYGYGKERRMLLGNRYTEVQERINELYKIANKVLNGEYGNGYERKSRLESEGYPYHTIQSIVNNFLS